MNRSEAIRRALASGHTSYAEIASAAKRLCGVVPSDSHIAVVRRKFVQASGVVNKVPRRVKARFPQVTRVQYANEPIDVSVTTRDCRGASKMDPSSCAMARAVNRECDVDGAMIGMSYSYLINGKTAVKYKTPESVKREIVSFDRHNDFATGEYRLSPVAASQQGKRRAKRGIRTDRSSEPKRIIHKGTARVRSGRG